MTQISPTIPPISLVEYTLDKLKQNISTKSIETIIKDPKYNRVIAENVCRLILKLYKDNLFSYNKALQDFIDFTHEFIKLQIELERTGHYHFSSYEEARKNIYDNPQVMEQRYLNGLLFSQAFWLNQNKILAFFIDEFCKNNSKKGCVVEVPVGTGIFLSEFIKHNQQWNFEGYDISKSAVQFSKDVINSTINLGLINQTIAGLEECNTKIQQKDVFKMDNNRKYHRIICGLLLENLDNPLSLLNKLQTMLTSDGKIFLTSTAWASTIDHIYLFKSAQEIRNMINDFFIIEKDLVLNIFLGKGPEEEKTPINYACILRQKTNNGGHR